MKKPIPPQLLKKPFSVQEALSCGLSRAYLTRMVKAGVLERLGCGVYQVSDNVSESMVEELYSIATLRCGIPSAVCLLSALDYYHVTDQIPKQTWMLVPVSKRIVSKDLKLIRSRNPKWNIGIHKTKSYWITTLERTLIDCLIYKRFIGSPVAIEAIKEALSQKKVKLGDVYDMAKKMGVAHRIYAYIEVLTA